jgi:hypothetical protein
MLEKPASIVLASLRGSTYRSVRLHLFARCGLAGRPFEHPRPFWISTTLRFQRYINQVLLQPVIGKIVYRMTVEVGSRLSGAGLGWI